jgi:hypothetical protein
MLGRLAEPGIELRDGVLGVQVTAPQAAEMLGFEELASLAGAGGDLERSGRTRGGD